MLEKVDDLGDKKSDEEKAHAKRLGKRIKSFKKIIDERAKEWKEARCYVNGNPEDDDDDGLVRTNLIGSVLETIQPAIYAKAPEIAVTVDENLDTSNYALLGGFAETLQNVLNRRLVKDAKLKVRGKTAVRGALTTTIGWVKVVYQRNMAEDPIIRNRINDAGDNINRLQVLIDETKEVGGDYAEHEAKLFELKQLQSSLESKVEVVRSKGLVVDYVPTEDIIILDDSCRDIDDFMQASAIAHRVKMTVASFKSKFKKSPPKSAKLHVDSSEDAIEQGSDIDDDDKLLFVYEVWSKDDNTVYTILEGSDTYVTDPYQPGTLGEQWYPFFGLQLRRVDGVKYPKSTVEQLIELQDEYNTMRTNAREHRAKNIPIRVINKATGITDDEINAINNRKASDDVVGVSADPNTPMQQQLGHLPEIPYNPQMYDTSSILFDMEKVGNTQDASTGAIRVAKTATEAEIQSAGMQGRTGESLDVIEDWLTDIAEYSAQVLLQNEDEEEIKSQFGQNAVWPTLSKEEYFSLINISIRAGSTSRPNKMRERDQWLQLLPIIQEALDRLIQAKASGQTEIVETIIALLDETLHRFDERLDAKELLGISDQQDGDQQNGQTEGQEQGQEQGQGGGQPAIPPEVMQQLQQFQQQMQQQVDALLKENEALKQEKSNKESELSLKEREVAIKERDMDLKETVTYGKHNLESSKVELEVKNEKNEQHLLEQNMQVIQVISQAMSDFNATLATLKAPKHKTGVARRMPDGSYVLEAVEEVSEQVEEPLSLEFNENTGEL
jgi:hypothetical protein